MPTMAGRVKALMKRYEKYEQNASWIRWMKQHFSGFHSFVSLGRKRFAMLHQYFEVVGGALGTLANKNHATNSSRRFHDIPMFDASYFWVFMWF